MEIEPVYQLTLTESQLFYLRDMLDMIADEETNNIDNPSEDLEGMTNREMRVELLDETMEFFDLVKSKIDEIYEQEND